MVQRFDPTLVFDTLRRTVESDSYRIGLNYSPNLNNTFLVSAISQDLDDQTTLFGNQVDANSEGKQYEVQYIYRSNSINLVTGLERLHLDTTTLLTIPFFGSLPPSKDSLQQNIAHLYLTLPRTWGQATLGVDYVDLDEKNTFAKHQYNPKFGLLLNATDSTLLRLAAFKTLRAEVLDNQSLIPTEIAGFNQVYDDYLSTEAKRYAIGIDHSFVTGLDGGFEFSRRDITTIPDTFTMIEEEQDELGQKAYLYWQINNRFKLSGEYIYEKFERDFIDGMNEPDRPAVLDTKSLSISGSYFHPSGFFTDLKATHVSQDIEEVLFTTGTSKDSDSFMITDATLGYRLPKRYGLVKLEVKNIFDKSFNFQSTFPGTGTPASSPYYPERSLFLNAQFWF